MDEQIAIKDFVRKYIPKMDDCSIVKLTGDASTRSYLRICPFHLNQSYIVCVDKNLVNNMSYSFIEVQKYLQVHNVCVPNILAVDYKHGMVLEEDLGDETLLKCLAGVSSKEVEYKLYKDAIDELLKMHRVPLEVEAEKINKCQFYQLRFDHEKLMSEIEFTHKHFLNGLLNLALGNEEEKAILNEYSKICKKLESIDRVFTHRDYHSRNIMCSRERLVVIDFQDARQGPPQYDLASLLDDCYYKICQTNIDKLKEYYWQEMTSSRSIQQSYKEFLYFYDLMVLQRAYKAIGSFAYIYHYKKDLRYLKYIGFAFEKIRSLMMNYNEFSCLRKTLSQLYYAT